MEGANLARAVDLVKFRKLRPPKDGADGEAVGNYAASLGRKIEVEWKSPNEILLRGQINEGEGISLAVTWDRGWECEVSRQPSAISRQPCRVERDVLGNILIDPRASGNLEVQLEF